MVRYTKFQSVLGEIKRRQLQFNGMPLDIEFMQEASKQRLCEDEFDRVFDDPMIQLKVRGVLGSDFCDAVGIYYTADEQEDDITVGLDEIPSGDNKWIISHVAT